MSLLRAIVALSRLSYLPAIWSNCLAGWWLGGGGRSELVPFLLGGASLIFLGGVFLNDAFDAEFDQRQHPSRPIPSGALTRKSVWVTGIVFLVLGALVFVPQREATGVLGLTLVFFAVLYNALHRWFKPAPVVWGACRFLLYLLGASIATRGITGWSIWCGLAMGIYAIGAMWLPRISPAPNKAPTGPLLLLSAPVGLALVMNAGGYREAALLLSAVLIMWILRSLRQGIWSSLKDPARSGPGLLAGMVFVDWLALAHAPRELHFFLICLFLTTLVFQRFLNWAPSTSPPVPAKPV